MLLEGNSRRERLDKNKKTDTLERLKEERKRKDAKRQKGTVLDNFFGVEISIRKSIGEPITEITTPYSLGHPNS